MQRRVGWRAITTRAAADAAGAGPRCFSTRATARAAGVRSAWAPATREYLGLSELRAGKSGRGQGVRALPGTPTGGETSAETSPLRALRRDDGHGRHRRRAALPGLFPRLSARRGRDPRALPGVCGVRRGATKRIPAAPRAVSGVPGGADRAEPRGGDRTVTPETGAARAEAWATLLTLLAAMLDRAWTQAHDPATGRWVRKA